MLMNWRAYFFLIIIFFFFLIIILSWCQVTLLGAKERNITILDFKRLAAYLICFDTEAT